MKAPILYANKDLRIGQSVRLNELFKMHCPYGYGILGDNIFLIEEFENGKIFARVSCGDTKTIWHTAYLRTAYLKDVKE